MQPLRPGLKDPAGLAHCPLPAPLPLCPLLPATHRHQPTARPPMPITHTSPSQHTHTHLQAGFRAKLGVYLGVPPTDILLTVSAASVRVVATIYTLAGAAP